MKIIHYLLAAFCLLLATTVVATGQTLPVQFTYDAVGNRILRYTENPIPAPAPPTDEIQNDTIPTPQDSIPATFRVTVYPNPVITNLQISIEVLDNHTQLPATFSLSLVSMQGSTIYHQTHTAQSPIFISMHGCLSGYYQLIVMRGTETHQLTIIKI